MASHKSYTKNYFKIYFYNIFSVLLGFASLFVVLPYLSSNSILYGIYSLCVSYSVFLTYSDLGFLTAGVKYATESYIKGDLELEHKYLGNTSFILFICTSLFGILFIIFSLHPGWIINDLKTYEEKKIATQLLLIIGLFSLTVTIQRLPQMILSIRIKQYIFQKITLIGNLIKIMSVFFFFGNGRYMIVEYFFTIQLITLICSLIACVYIGKKYNYHFISFFKNFRLTKGIIKKVYVLALSSLISTICWILYYEMDNIAIGKFLGTESVAIYAIGFSLLNFVRTLLGILFSPFSVRFNHFKGLNEMSQLQNFYKNLIEFFFPIVFFPLLILSLICYPFILSWVGPEYSSSVVIAQLLVCCNIGAFISYPAGSLLIALEKIKMNYVVSLINVLVFWTGILFTIDQFELLSFPLFKLITFAISFGMYTMISKKFLGCTIFRMIKHVKPYIIPILITFILVYFTFDYYAIEKSAYSLLRNIILYICTLTLIFTIIILVNPAYKQMLIYRLTNIFKSSTSQNDTY